MLSGPYVSPAYGFYPGLSSVRIITTGAGCPDGRQVKMRIPVLLIIHESAAAPDNIDNKKE
ncbi:MAG: hypothetical protein ABIB93_06940 [Chloroflexota bacterium]